MQIKKKLSLAVAVALMGASFGAGTFLPSAEACHYVTGKDGLYTCVSDEDYNSRNTGTSKPSTTPKVTKPSTTPTTTKPTTTKPSTTVTKPTTTKPTTTKPTTQQTPAKPITTKPTTTAAVATQNVLTKLVVKEPTSVTQVTIVPRDKRYLTDAAKFPIQKVGTIKNFSGTNSTGTISYYKNAIRISETINKNRIPAKLTYINMGTVRLTTADIKGVINNHKDLMRHLDDTYTQTEKDYGLNRHGILHVWYNDKDRVYIDLEIPNDTYVQQKIKVNNDLRTKLKNLDKQRNDAMTVAASALAQTKTAKANADSVMSKEYYPEWNKTTEPLRVERDGIKTNLSYLNTQMTSLNTQLKTLQTKKTAADTKVKTLTTQKTAADTKVKTLTAQKTSANTKVKNLTAQKTKAKTTAEKNKIQTQITAAQKSLTTVSTQLTAAQKQQSSLTTQLTTAQTSQKSLTSQITSTNTKKASLQKNIDITNARLKTVEAQWQKSWSKITVANTKVNSYGTTYNKARTQYLNSKNTIEDNKVQILKLNPNAIVKDWKATNIPTWSL